MPTINHMGLKFKDYVANAVWTKWIMDIYRKICVGNVSFFLTDLSLEIPGSLFFLAGRGSHPPSPDRGHVLYRVEFSFDALLKYHNWGCFPRLLWLLALPVWDGPGGRPQQGPEEVRGPSQVPVRSLVTTELTGQSVQLLNEGQMSEWW